MLTNEEKKLEIYASTEKPTEPSKVTPNTPLEDLNLNWRENDLPQKIRTKHVHGLHPYLGKFIPQLVEIFLRKYFKSGDTILDPFCGSGTALVQANELGINSIGSDISAFNVLLCKAKTQQYDLKQVKFEIYDVLNKTKKAVHDESIQLKLWNDHLDVPDQVSETSNEYLNNWFADNTLRELLTYRYFVIKNDYKYKDILKIILTRSARSARLTTHYDLDFPKEPQTEPYWCYKHSRTCTPVQEAYKFFKRYSKDTFKRLKAFNHVRTNAKVSVIHGDSRELGFSNLDGIITSPPYVGLIDYHDQHAYAYALLNLDDRRTDEIGPASNGKSKSARKQYKDGVVDVFKNTLKAVKPGGIIIVIAGDKHNIYPKIANSLDVTVEAVIKRHVNRRTGRRNSDFYESVFIWRKE
jgi:DNA modification methylase